MDLFSALAASSILEGERVYGTEYGEGVGRGIDCWKGGGSLLTHLWVVRGGGWVRKATRQTAHGRVKVLVLARTRSNEDARTQFRSALLEVTEGVRQRSTGQATPAPPRKVTSSAGSVPSPL